MGVADEGDAFDAFEDGLELVGLVGGVVGEDVFVDRAAGGGVDGQDRGVVPQQVLDLADGEAAEVFVAFGPLLLVGLGVEDGAGPEGGGLGGGVEVGWFVEDAEVVVAHQGPGAVLADEVDAEQGVGPVTDDVAEADDFVDAAVGDVGEDGAQRLGVAVDIGDDCGAHFGSLCG